MRVPLPKGLKFLSDLMIENGLNPWLVGSAARMLYDASKKKTSKTRTSSRSKSRSQTQTSRRRPTKTSSSTPKPRDYDLIFSGATEDLLPILSANHLRHQTNHFGGIKAEVAGVSVDLWPDGVLDFLVRSPVAQTGIAIHLQSGCVLLTGEYSQGLKGLVTSRATCGDAPPNPEYYKNWVAKYLT